MTGWSGASSPFHEGEQQAQDRAGVRVAAEAQGRRAIRDFMPDQHREFYAQIPFVLLGSVDEQGRPWASLVAGGAGFMTSPDPRRLEVTAALIPGDPLGAALRPGAPLGLLGIELETRRRNRLSGTVVDVRAGGFSIAIEQSFGNCPKYIQTRAVEFVPPDPRAAAPAPTHTTRLDDATQAQIERADSLFIATAYPEGEGAAGGADVSHRGGKPGFVRVEDERTLVFPDFSGNNHFNTVGNILVNPRAGYLFVDFETRDVVSITGAAEIVWEGAEVSAFVGAERLVRLRADEVIRVERGLPLRTSFGEYSPVLARTGSWVEAEQQVAAERARNDYARYRIVGKAPESETITSFVLRRLDDRPLPVHQPGQHLPIRVSVPGYAEPLKRTYTLSAAANGVDYRLSIKREPEGAVSRFLHDEAEPGFELEAAAPRGRFVLDRSSERPIVLLSAGVGVTPVIAMAEAIVQDGLRSGVDRRTVFVHGARDGRTHAFGDWVRQLSVAHPSFQAHVRLSQPTEADRLGETYDSQGRVDVALLKRVLPFDDHEFYVCGPAGFMQEIYDGLTDLGVRDERIHYEAFGPGTVRRQRAPGAPSEPVAPVPVLFAKSGVEATWTPSQGTLLELAESSGVAPEFGCRSGSCGSCATRITCGAVDYAEAPSGPHAEDEVLLCSARPRLLEGATRLVLEA